MRIALLGGTGREGRGLAVRWAKAGHVVVLGSRDAARAAEVAAELSGQSGGSVEGADHASAVGRSEVVVVSVPYAGHGDLLRVLRPLLPGRLLIDITVPLRPPHVRVVTLPAGQAAALEAQALLGPESRVVAMLHHVSAAELSDPSHAIDCDVLVCSDHEDAKEVGLRLVADLGLRGLDAGPLRNAVALESLTPVLLHLNKRYKSAGTGIRITGLP